MIALLGYGFVGKAYYNAFNLYHEITIVDPNFNNTCVEDIKNLIEYEKEKIVKFKRKFQN